MDRVRSRASFDTVAEIYDRVRPGYPERMFADLAALAGVGAGSRVLEIGCGTGQATVPLLLMGARITAVELGPRLAEIARRNLTAAAAMSEVGVDSDAAEVVVADFERWRPPADGYDLVLAATSFHWIDPRTRWSLVADALRPGGVSATVTTYHVAGGSSSFFTHAQSCHRRFDSAAPAKLRLPDAVDIPFDRDLGHPSRFGPPQFRRYEWDATYTAGQYRDLLHSYAPTLALEPADRRGLLDCVTALIDRKFHGKITKRYLTELRLAVCVDP